MFENIVDQDYILVTESLLFFERGEPQSPKLNDALKDYLIIVSNYMNSLIEKFRRLCNDLKEKRELLSHKSTFEAIELWLNKMEQMLTQIDFSMHT